MEELINNSWKTHPFAELVENIFLKKDVSGINGKEFGTRFKQLVKYNDTLNVHKVRQIEVYDRKINDLLLLRERIVRSIMQQKKPQESTVKDISLPSKILQDK